MDITIAEFTYTKSNGDKSQRQLLVLSSPNDSYFGLEIADNDLTEVQPYLDYLAEKREMEEFLRLKHGLDELDLPYKRFKVKGITKLTEEKVTVK